LDALVVLSKRNAPTTAPAPRLDQLQGALGHSFANVGLLRQALTHRSYSADHYERLEFLGDSVLNLAVSALLYQRLGDLPEGDLSRVRANLVKQDTLVMLAERLSLAPYLHLGEGEHKSGGRSRPSILADAVEAIIGAMYIDAGFATAQAFVQRLYADMPLGADKAAMRKDAKTALQEWLQGRKMALPTYKVERILGEAHQQTFEVSCTVPALGLTAVGSGTSRRIAEQAGAGDMLAQLQSTTK
jgi:ribonuclease III